LSSHLRLGLPSGLLPSGLPTKMLYAPLTSPMRATSELITQKVIFYSYEQYYLPLPITGLFLDCDVMQF
jgi:hypothetical protein